MQKQSLKSLVVLSLIAVFILFLVFASYYSDSPSLLAEGSLTLPLDLGLFYLVGIAFFLSILNNYIVTLPVIVLVVVSQSLTVRVMFSHLFKKIITSQNSAMIDSSLISETYVTAIASLLAVSCFLTKLRLFQLSVASFLAAIAYELNRHICIEVLKMQDSGRAVTVFAFAGAFSLVQNFVFKRKQSQGQEKQMIPSLRGYAIGAMGAIFLFVMFASLNVSLIPSVATTRLQMGYLNTLITLSAGTCFGAVLSYQLRGKIDPLDFIRMIYCSGVGAGCCADLMFNPGLSFLLALVVVGVTYPLQMFNPLNKQVGNAVGIDKLGLASGTISCVFSGLILVYLANFGTKIDSSPFFNDFPYSLRMTAGYQLICLAITLAIGSIAGLSNGLVWYFMGQSMEGELEASESQNVHQQVNLDRVELDLFD